MVVLRLPSTSILLILTHLAVRINSVVCLVDANFESKIFLQNLLSILTLLMQRLCFWLCGPVLRDVDQLKKKLLCASLEFSLLSLSCAPESVEKYRISPNWISNVFNANFISFDLIVS